MEVQAELEAMTKTALIKVAIEMGADDVSLEAIIEGTKNNAVLVIMKMKAYTELKAKTKIALLKMAVEIGMGDDSLEAGMEGTKEDMIRLIMALKFPTGGALQSSCMVGSSKISTTSQHIKPVMDVRNNETVIDRTSILASRHSLRDSCIHCGASFDAGDRFCRVCRTCKARQSARFVPIGKNIANVTAGVGIDAAKALASDQFQTWVHNISKEHRLEVSNVQLQSVDVFGSQVGFIKFIAGARVDDKQLPTIVFLRGIVVAVFVILHHEDQKYTLVIRQPRVPVGINDVAEIPAGKVDEGGKFVGAAADVMKEEVNIHIAENDVIDLTCLAYESKFQGVFASCGVSDEHFRILLYQKRVSTRELESLKAKLTPTANNIKQIRRLQIIPLGELWRKSPDAKALAAMCLYEKLEIVGLIPKASKESFKQSWEDVARQSEQTTTKIEDTVGAVKKQISHLQEQIHCRDARILELEALVDQRQTSARDGLFALKPLRGDPSEMQRWIAFFERVKKHPVDFYEQCMQLFRRQDIYTPEDLADVDITLLENKLKNERVKMEQVLFIKQAFQLAKASVPSRTKDEMVGSSQLVGNSTYNGDDDFDEDLAAALAMSMEPHA